MARRNFGAGDQNNTINSSNTDPLLPKGKDQDKETELDDKSERKRSESDLDHRQQKFDGEAASRARDLELNFRELKFQVLEVNALKDLISMEDEKRVADGKCLTATKYIGDGLVAVGLLTLGIFFVVEYLKGKDFEVTGAIPGSTSDKVASYLTPIVQQLQRYVFTLDPQKYFGTILSSVGFLIAALWAVRSWLSYREDHHYNQLLGAENRTRNLLRAAAPLMISIKDNLEIVETNHQKLLIAVNSQTEAINQNRIQINAQGKAINQLLQTLSTHQMWFEQLSKELKEGRRTGSLVESQSLITADGSPSLYPATPATSAAPTSLALSRPASYQHSMFSTSRGGGI